MATCSSCGASIIWLRTPKGKWMPANEGLVPYYQNDEGKDFVVTDRGEMIRCDIITEKLPATGGIRPTGRFPTGMARVPHWATCPNAARHKRRE